MVVSGSKVEGGTQILSAGVRKTIQSIKEIVGNHSESDIYVALKETNMDPNETTQKLLNQDPFREVRRRKDKKKENTGKNSTAAESRKQFEHVGQTTKFNMPSDHYVRRGGYNRNVLHDAGVNREFRVVRDNRLNQIVNRETKPSHNSTSTSEPVISNVNAKSISTGASGTNRPSSIGHPSFQASNGLVDSQSPQPRGTDTSVNKRPDLSEGRRSVVSDASDVRALKPSNSQPHSTTSSSNNSVIGVYSSSFDPVHVPSLDPRPSANIGAIKREIGVVGSRRNSSESSGKLSSSQSSSVSISHSGRDGATSREQQRSFSVISRNDQPSHNMLRESAMPPLSVNRSFSNNQYNSRTYQPSGHQKASQPNKEWKPKSSQKSSANGPGVIGTPTKAVSPPTDNSKHLDKEDAQLQDKISRVIFYENQNVIIAAHIRVSETDRSRLTFGTLGTEVESSKNTRAQAIRGVDEQNAEPSGSLPASAPEALGNEPVSSKQLDLIDDRVRNSGSNSPMSGTMSEHQSGDKKDSLAPESLDNYADIRLVQDSSPSYTPPNSHQQQDTSDLPAFSAYDPQMGYDIPYFRPAIDETVRGHGLPSHQEALSSHATNSIPASTMSMVQQMQQQQPVAQMYPQLHVSHYANLMPYRQFLPPVYVPPVAMPGYSSNPAYPHPSNGSSYVLMPGGGSHLNASGLKYGIQQFKPLPTGSPTGFGNFTSPTGYAINAPGVVGSAAAHEDSSRLKYKDSNLYVPSPQAETSEIWMNPRDIPALQSASYYNVPGQTTHAAYLPSHSGHASFNAAAAVGQSSHMQFPGLYHPTPQPAAIANPHHLGPAMGANVGVGVAGAAPGPQVGAYQQPQLGHLNWTGNF